MTKIRKVLGGVSFIALLLLLNQPTTRGQSFGDNVQYNFSNCGKPLVVKVPGTPINDYTPKVSNKTLLCRLSPTITQSAATSGTAQLGFGLSVDTVWNASGFASGGGSSASASDTIFLAAPAGFKGTSISIPITLTYHLGLKGVTPVGPGDASACWVLHGTTTCRTTTTDQDVTKMLTITVMVIKTAIGFELPIKIFAVASGDSGYGKTTVQATAYIFVSTPLTLPPGWKYTWASGE